MNQLTDLDICQRIAKIEGLQISAVGEFSVYVKSDSKSGHYAYNPLTDDALCFRLMIKYDMAPFKCEFGGYECVYDMDLVLSGSGITNDENPNRAICLAIIKPQKR